MDAPKIETPDIKPIGDMAYNVTPIVGEADPVIGDFNPRDSKDPNGDNPDEDNPDPVTGGGGPEPSSDTGGGGISFAPVITIQVQGNADDETIEKMEKSLRDMVKELFEEFREQELEQMSLKNQYAY